MLIVIADVQPINIIARALLLKKKFAGKNLRHGRVLVVADGQLLDVNWEVAGKRG